MKGDKNKNKFIACNGQKAVVYNSLNDLWFAFPLPEKELKRLIETGEPYNGWTFDRLFEGSW